MNIQHIALIGAGAIGSVYAAHLSRHYGDHFAVAATGERARRLSQAGITVNGKCFFPRVVDTAAEAFAADLILVCVKNYHLEATLSDMAPLVGPHTVIVPLLNGITARDRIAERFFANPVLYGLAIYIDALRGPDGVHNTDDGVIQLGQARNTPPSALVNRVSDALTHAGLRIEVCPDMLRAVWKKWMLNVGCNQAGAVTRAPNRLLASLPGPSDLFVDAMREVVALAQAAGIHLTEADVQEFLTLMRQFSPSGKTSMLQDVLAGRKTEVESFGGTVSALGRKYGVPTPVNDMLTRILRATEQVYSSK